MLSEKNYRCDVDGREPLACQINTPIARIAKKIFERTCFMTQLHVQPGQYVAIEIEQKTRTRYEKALVDQVTANEIVLRKGRHYDLEGFPLKRDGQRKQLNSETGTLVPLTPFVEQRIERQEVVDELANMDWTTWMMVPTDVLGQVKALLQESLSKNEPFS